VKRRESLKLENIKDIGGVLDNFQTFYENKVGGRQTAFENPILGIKYL